MVGMRFFQRAKRRIFGVVDVGSDTIKALLFSVSRGHPAANAALARRRETFGAMSQGHLASTSGTIGGGTQEHRDTGTGTVPSTARTIGSGKIRPIEKFVWDLPEQYTGVRLVRKIRECVFRMVQRLEEVPEQILIAVGPTVAECAISTWRMSPGAGGTVLTRRDIRAYYHDLFTRERDLRRAVIVALVDVFVNGYPLARPAGDAADGGAVLPRAQVKEITFRTLSLYLSVENGATFAEIKNALGGMPIEFIPLAAAHTWAVTSVLGMRDACVVDAGGSETTVLSIRGGRLAAAAFIPFGARGFGEDLSKKTGRSFAEAQKEMRVRAQALASPAPAGDGEKDPAAAAAGAAAARWKALFVASLGSFAASGPLPADLLLTGGGAYFPEIRAALMASDWMGGVSHVAAPRMRVMDGASLFGGDTLGGYLAGPEDAGLASLMAYAMTHKPMF